MVKLTTNLLSLIGNTPMLELEGVFCKLEHLNPSGSIKDRMALHMIQSAQKKGILKKGQSIIECTSGNTGIAFSMLSCYFGYKFTAIMPENMSIERIKIMKFFGAKLILTPAKLEMSGAYSKYKEIFKRNKKAWYPRQFENPDNYLGHVKGLGKEIIEQMDGKIDAFVAGIGTGGSIIGVAKALRKVNPNIKIIGIEPSESAVISGGKAKHHRLEGIGEGFIPKLVEDHLDEIDEIVKIKSADALKMRRTIALNKGIFAGIVSGANFLASLKIKKKYNLKRVVTLFTDRGERYLSLD